MGNKSNRESKIALEAPAPAPVRAYAAIGPQPPPRAIEKEEEKKMISQFEHQGRYHDMISRIDIDGIKQGLMIIYESHLEKTLESYLKKMHLN
jgi:hypothetical protein